jgi:hypothetical protein
MLEMLELCVVSELAGWWGAQNPESRQRLDDSGPLRANDLTAGLRF